MPVGRHLGYLNSCHLGLSVTTMWTWSQGELWLCVTVDTHNDHVLFQAMPRAL